MSWLIVTLIVVPYFAFASTKAVDALRQFNRSRLHGILLATFFLIPYLLTAPSGSLSDLARMSAYIYIPTLILLYRPRNHKALDLLDVMAIIALWLPIEFDWLPNEVARITPGISLPVPKLIGVDLAFLLYLIIRPVGGIGYSYNLSKKDIQSALTALLAFSIVGLPLGLALRFIGFDLAPFQPGDWIIKLLVIFLLIGVPEELLFRGLIQNLIEKRFSRNWITLIFSALIFGAAHLDNATTGYAVPNFVYMIMASLAGIAYGWAWQKSGKITVAAITHALVDWLWGVILGG